MEEPPIPICLRINGMADYRLIAEVPDDEGGILGAEETYRSFCNSTPTESVARLGSQPWNQLVRQGAICNLQLVKNMAMLLHSVTSTAGAPAK